MPQPKSVAAPASLSEPCRISEPACNITPTCPQCCAQRCMRDGVKQRCFAPHFVAQAHRAPGAVGSPATPSCWGFVRSFERLDDFVSVR